MASRLQDVLLRGNTVGKPLATDVAHGTLYFDTTLNVTERSNGTIWESYSGVISGTAPLHAPTHSDGGTDPVTVTDLGGYPGGGTTFLRDDGTFTAIPAAPAVRRQITVVIDGGGSAITTGLKTFVSLPVGGTWKKWRVLSIDAGVLAGSIVIDVWKDVYSAYPPVVGDSITGTDKPTLSAVNKNESVALTGWTPIFAAGDVLGFNVDSAATVMKVSLTLEFE